MSDANAHLQAQLDQLLGQYDTMRKSIADVHSRMRKVSGQAESADHLVSATVGPRGALSELRLDAKAYRKLSPSQLAAAIVEVVQRAGADASAQVTALLTPVLPAGVAVDELVRGDTSPTEWSGGNRLTSAGFEEWWTDAGKSPR